MDTVPGISKLYTPDIHKKVVDIKQLLDEVEHDIMNLISKTEVCVIALIIHNIMRKPNSIIVLLYIFHIIHTQKQKRSVQPF